MTTAGAGFIEAIVAAPDDDAVRLVYADVLDDAGQPKRAELIRLQVACRSLLNGQRPMPPEDDLAFCLDIRRSFELIEVHGYGWCDGLLGPDWKTSGNCKYTNGAVVSYHKGDKHTGEIGVAFEGGFVESVVMDAADWLAHAEALVAAAPLKEVRLTTMPGHEVLTQPQWHIGPEWTGTGLGYVCTFAQRKVHVQHILSKRWDRIRFSLPD